MKKLTVIILETAGLYSCVSSKDCTIRPDKRR